MAEEALPAIKLTDTNNEEKEPARPFSPAGEAPPPLFDPSPPPSKEQRGRPETPTSTTNTPKGKSKSKSSDRPDSAGKNSGARASPGRLRNSLSNLAIRASSDTDREAGANGLPDGSQAQPAGIDPLSQHILARTSTQFNSPNRGRSGSSDNAANRTGRASVDQGSGPSSLSPVERVDSFESVNAHKDLRKGVKAVAFITKLMGNRKKDDDGAAEDESTSNEGRPEGTDAEVFAQPVETIGFNASMPQPPAYIKMRSKFKKEKEFDRVFLAQELHGRRERKIQRQNSGNKLRRKSSAPGDTSSTVWAMEFSRSGKYMAAAGADGIVRVWKVISNLDDRHKHEQQESVENDASGTEPHAEHLSAPVFVRQPVREYEGHTSTVLDLSWSKNDFLLSSSMDKTVRLWHVTRPECLCTFKHNDFVPSIAFHPRDDRFFLAGSLDSKLRLWSIPDKSVAYAARLPDLITAVAFTPDGKTAIAGCLGGACMFYETDGMKYQSQVQVRSTRGQNAKGCKITGIQGFYDARGDAKILITSNDSRIRVYNLRDKNLEIKFRGNENNYSQIRSMISDDGRYVVCGSEDRKAYIWSLGPTEDEKPDKRPVEMFEPHNSITTVVCFAPAKTRLLLGESEDPLYDLCNPPPATLLSQHERQQSRAGSIASSRPASIAGSMPATPADAKSEFKKPKESASYLARSSHRGGNIIVTADFSGNIKVFRQDCPWTKRIKSDDWDRSSLFSKRNGRVSRNGSVITRGSQPSLRDARTSLSSSGPQDRILHWRQGISSSPNINDTRASPKETPRSMRSISPSKSEDQHSNGDSPATAAGATQFAKTSAPSISTKPGGTAASSSAIAQALATGSAPRTPDSPSKAHDDNPLRVSGGRSYLFWDTEDWRYRVEGLRKSHAAHEEAQRMEQLETIASRGDVEVTPGAEGSGGPHTAAGSTSLDTNHLSVRPTLDRGTTAVSELSDERSSVSEYDDAPEEKGKEKDQGLGTNLKCMKCGNGSFQAKKSKVGMTLVCKNCGTRVDSR